MSRFASPIQPGQLGGPAREAVEGIGMAGQFAQQNLDRQEQARQANMADSTRRAAMTQEERMQREAQASQERQAGIQRQHEAGMQRGELDARRAMQTQELDARSRLQMEHQQFAERQAQLNRQFQLDMEERVRKARNADMLAEREAWVAGLEARSGKRSEARAKREERWQMEADLAQARIDTEKGERDLGEAKTRAIEFVDGNFNRADEWWKRGKAAGANAIAKLGLDSSDLLGLGVGVDEPRLLEWLLGSQDDRAESLLNASGAQSLGLGASNSLDDSLGGVSGDVEGAKAKLMRKAAEHVAKSIASAGGPASAADSDVVEAIHEFMTKAAAARGSEAAGTPAKLDELKAVLDRVGAKVSATEIYAAFDGMGEAAEAQALQLRSQLLQLQNEKGGTQVTAQTLRLALQAQTMEALAGIDNAANLALEGKVDRPEMWARLKAGFVNRTSPDQLDADSLADLLRIDNGKWSDRISPLLQEGGGLYGLLDAAERQKGRMSREQSLQERRARTMARTEEDLYEIGVNEELEGARTVVDTLKRLLELGR